MYAPLFSSVVALPLFSFTPQPDRYVSRVPLYPLSPSCNVTVPPPPVVTTVIDTLADVLAPRLSVATAWSVWLPNASPLTDALYGTVASVPTSAPSR